MRPVRGLPAISTDDPFDVRRIDDLWRCRIAAERAPLHRVDSTNVRRPGNGGAGWHDARRRVCARLCVQERDEGGALRGIAGSMLAAAVAAAALLARGRIGCRGRAAEHAGGEATGLGARRAERHVGAVDGQLEPHFSSAFLKAVPPASLLDALTPVRSSQPLRLAAVLDRDGQVGLKVRVETRSGRGYRVTLVVSKTTHLIEGLLFEPIAAPLASWEQVDAALARLGAHASLFAGVAGGRRVHAVAADEPGAIGSAFKLYVLGALVDAIEHGSSAWHEQLAIRDAWKSLPRARCATSPPARGSACGTPPSR